MKNGLLIYPVNSLTNIFNIGDYIQSLAALQFCNREIDVYLNRERLDEYKGDPVKLIMNGWFMHNPTHWPPAPCIQPLFIAFHINNLAKEALLSKQSIRYLKLHEPIGCRDMNTLDHLRRAGVDAYFSGCLTLTLGKSYRNTGTGEKVYFVDPFFCVERSIKSIGSALITLIIFTRKIIRLRRRIAADCTLKALLRIAVFYKLYSQLFSDDVLLNADYINHEIADNFESESAKFNYARLLLTQYANAKYVVTSRIHCALPCLAMNTPVLYVENANDPAVSSCRLGGLKELFNIIRFSRNSLHIVDDIGVNRFTLQSAFCNKFAYKEISEKLISTCDIFKSL